MTMLLPLVIDPAQLASVLNNANVLIFDLSSAEHYEQGHVPHAVHMDPTQLLSGTPPIANSLPSEQQLSVLLSQYGVTQDTHIVVYDDQSGVWAGRLIWTLHCCGLEKASFLNGHLAAWVEAGFDLSKERHLPNASHLQVQLNQQYRADKAFLLRHLNDASLSIWDARSYSEYCGDKRVNVAKGGHIPGAHWLEWTEMLQTTEPARLDSPHHLRQKILNAGIDPKKTVVTHCQTHRRSGLTYIAARHAGIDDICCYDGSWFEWGNAPDTPTEI